MGFAYITDKFRGSTRVTHAWFRLLICCANYGIWAVWGTTMVYRQYKYGLLTGVLEMPSWLIGLAIPLSAICSIIRMVQYEMALKNNPEEQAKRKGE